MEAKSVGELAAGVLAEVRSKRFGLKEGAPAEVECHRNNRGRFKQNGVSRSATGGMPGSGAGKPAKEGATS